VSVQEQQIGQQLELQLEVEEDQLDDDEPEEEELNQRTRRICQIIEIPKYSAYDNFQI